MSLIYGAEHLGSNPTVIDDSNADRFVRQIVDPNEPFSGGYEEPTFDVGVGACDAMWDGPIIPQRDVPELIRFHEKNKSTADHWRLNGNCEILDQNGFPYCWMFGVVGAMQVALAKAGYRNVPKLCATATAARGKNWRKVGGWGEEAIGYIKQWGVPENSVWDEHDIGSASKWKQEAVQRSAAKTNVVRFLKLPTDRGLVPMEVVWSVLLNEHNPCPISAAYNWWGHLIFLSKWTEAGGLGVNSWGKRWEQNGTAIIGLSKVRPAEAIAIQTVQMQVSA